MSEGDLSEEQRKQIRQHREMYGNAFVAYPHGQEPRVLDPLSVQIALPPLHFVRAEQGAADYAQNVAAPSLRKMEQDLRLTWTTDTPTEPGKYWVRFYEPASEPDIVEVERTEGGLLVCWDAAAWEPVGALTRAMWSGPLQPPEVPE